MPDQMISFDFLACIPHAIESHWDNVWAPRLTGFPVNIVLAARIEGVGLAHSTYIFDPGTFLQAESSKLMQYRRTVDSDFSILVVLHQEGSIETFKYRASELISVSRGPDFQTAMVHATALGIETDEPRAISLCR